MQGARSAGTAVYVRVHEDSEHRATQQSGRVGGFKTLPTKSRCPPPTPQWSNPMNDIVIVGAKRTAIGSFLGQFPGVPTTTLGATAIKAALEHAALDANAVSPVKIGRT